MPRLQRLWTIFKALKDVWGLLPTSWKMVVISLVSTVATTVAAALGREPPARLIVYGLSAAVVGAVLTYVGVLLADELKEQSDKRDRLNRVWIEPSAVLAMRAIWDQNKPSFVRIQEAERFHGKWLTVQGEIEDIQMSSRDVLVNARAVGTRQLFYLLYFPPTMAEYFSCKPLGEEITVSGKLAHFSNSGLALKDCELATTSSPSASSSQPSA